MHALICHTFEFVDDPRVGNHSEARIRLLSDCTILDISANIGSRGVMDQVPPWPMKVQPSWFHSSVVLTQGLCQEFDLMGS